LDSVELLELEEDDRLLLLLDSDELDDSDELLLDKLELDSEELEEELD
jgi:hypothetical protein